jgi:hypothetical protein
MTEISFPVITNQDPQFPLNKALDFVPFGAWMRASMAAHGTEEDLFTKWREVDATKPRKSGTKDFSILLVETDMPWYLASWAVEQSDSQNSSKSEMAFKAE